MKTFKTVRNPSNSRISKVSRIFAIILALCFCLPIFSVTASAKSAKSTAEAKPSDLIQVVAEQTGLEPNIDALMEAGYLSAAEKRHLEKYNAFSYAVAWHVLLPAFGIYPYPAEFYPDISPCSSWSNGTVYADARAAGILLGLVDPSIEPNYAISKSDFTALVNKLKTSPKLPILQTDNPYVNAYEDAIASGEAAPWDIHSYRGRNSLLSAYDLIPAGWLATFQSLEYDVHFRLPTSRTPKIPGHTAAGVTNYAEKFIAVENCNPRATLHEFAHFAAKYAGLYVDDMERCYEHESSKVIAIIGIYSSLDFSEYLAEFASYWLLHPNDQSILRELAPETTALTEYLFHVLDYNIPVKTTA